MNHKEELTATIRRITGINPRKCMKCGKCTATCPAFDDMDYHPHQFVDMVEKGQIEKLMASNGIWNCMSCFACLERCPRQVEPAKLIEAVRLMAVRRQDGDRLKADDIPCMLDENTPGQLLMTAFRKYKK